MIRHGKLVGTALLALLVTAGQPVRTANGADGWLACRRAVGREGMRFFRKVGAIHRKCEERRLRAPQMTCPEVADEDRLMRARDRVRSGVIGSCSEALPPEFVGDCPAPCSANVIGATTLADCVACVAEAAIGNFTDLVFPDPAKPGAVCGDGQVGSAEECDPPDDGACPGRCAAPGEAGACECQPPESCVFVTQPPGSCTADDDCPPEYVCTDGQCEAGGCDVRADCPSDGQCVHLAGEPYGMCICRGCGPHDCPLACTAGNIGGLLIINGCMCNELDDCPPADDVCYQGICS